MKVINRDGDFVNVSYDAIRSRLLGLCNSEEQKQLDVDVIIIQTIAGLHDNITTSQLDELSAMTCATMQSKHYLYDMLAGRILVSSLHKNVRRIVGTEKPATFSQKIEYLSKRGDCVLNPEFVDFVQKYAARLDAIVDYSRDLERISYFSFRTLEKAYLLRSGDQVIESPQDMWMRVSVAVHFPRKSMDETSPDFDVIKRMYDQMSLGMYTHATPTLFNAGTRHEQMSSCYLLGTDDSLSGIFKTISDCAQISKWAGGIGVHISNIRARGSVINSTNGKSDGIIPMLKVYNETARYCNQCFVPDTIVYTKQGCKAIKDVDPGEDLVLTSDGTYRLVTDKIVNQKQEDILVIRPEYSITPLECTCVHEIFALTARTSTDDCALIRSDLEKGVVSPRFVSADTLRVEDFMAYPVPAQIQKDQSGMSEEDCRFYGIMIGGGSPTNTECYLTLKNAGSDTAVFVEQYLAEKGVKYYWATYSSGEHCNSISFLWSDKLPFGIDDLYSVPPNVMSVSNVKVLQLVKGLLEVHDFCDFSIPTRSKHLMESLRFLLLRLGIPTSGREQEGRIHVPRDPSLCRELGIMPSDTPSDTVGYFVWNGLIFNRIKSIETRAYEGNVFDLSIEQNHNYTTNCGLVHNSGRRKGSIATYLEPWHADVFEFLELRRNTGAESLRARDLFLALWIPDIFMQRVVEDGDWHLMSPDTSPGLTDTWGKDFEDLYQRYIDEGKFVKVVKARAVWTSVMQSQIETGNPYIMFKDSVNRRSNHNNVGTIRSSNLCVAPETQVLTDKGYRVISEMQDEDVSIWNGQRFSEVTVRKTGSNQPLVTVKFSNGESLDCTPYHKFFVQDDHSTEVVITAKELVPGMRIAATDMPILDEDGLKADFDDAYSRGIRFASGEDTHVLPEGQKLQIKLRWLEGVVDGSGEVTHDGVEISCPDKAPLQSIKRLLNTMGADAAHCGTRVLGTGADTINLYRLVIRSDSLGRLVNLGFCPHSIRAMPLSNRSGDTCISVTAVIDRFRKDDTFCFSEPVAHAGVFNGIRTGQCAEIIQYSDSETYAVCNLASIAVNRFLDLKNKSYDFASLHDAARQVTRNLNRIIDLNFYPTPETKRSNMSMRPIGIGIQGFGDLCNALGLDYDSSSSMELGGHIMETIYHGAVTESIAIAKEEGPYPKFEGSMFSKGVFQFDLYDDFDKTMLRHDWETLRRDIVRYGIRNSMLTALMPTASTSQIMGNSECFEPVQSNAFKRKTLAGEFMVVNKHLMMDLMKLGLWDENTRTAVMMNDGSVQDVPGIPDAIRKRYRTVWELPQKSVVDHAVYRSRFVDQSQSMNLFFAVPNFSKLNSALTYAWRRGLKTGSYYLRCKPATEAIKTSFLRSNEESCSDIDSSAAAAAPPVGPACFMNEGCVVCSS